MNREGRSNPEDALDNLQRMLDCSSALRHYMEHFGPYGEAFAGNEMYRDCCFSKIDQMILCIDRLSELHPEIHDDHFGEVSIEGIRLLSVRAYEHIDPSAVWGFLVNDLPVIEDAARDAIKKLPISESDDFTPDGEIRTRPL